MNHPSVVALIFLLGAGAGAGAGAARADESCVDFKWDASAEHVLFAGAAVTLKAGADFKSAPAIEPNRLYALQLLPQGQVTFMAAPGKSNTTVGANAGLATLKVDAPGRYRVSLDAPFWIDVVADGALLKATDFQGQHSCSAPHKIVEFELPNARPFILQLSSASAATVRLAVTPAPPRKQ